MYNIHIYIYVYYITYILYITIRWYCIPGQFCVLLSLRRTSSSQMHVCDAVVAMVSGVGHGWCPTLQVSLGLEDTDYTNLTTEGRCVATLPVAPSKSSKYSCSHCSR
jgi:hypothetical protein